MFRPCFARCCTHWSWPEEDIEHWCGGRLTDEQLNASPSGSCAGRVSISGTSREGRPVADIRRRQARLNEEQIAAMKAELDGGATRGTLFAELQAALVKSSERIRAFDPAALDEPRKVGKKRLPTTVERDSLVQTWRITRYNATSAQANYRHP